MCGGGGGDGGVAERQAQMKAEQDRAIQEVNTIFGKGQGSPIYGQVEQDGPFGVKVPTQGVVGYDPTQRDKNAAARTQLYGKITSDASARLLDKLGRDRDDAARGTRFQLARQGLAGGSADIDQNSEILSKFQEGSLEAANSAAAAGNSARTADEKTRVGIIGNIRNGMAQSDAMSSAFAALENNAAEARDAALSSDIGQFFADINNRNEQRQFQLGQQGAMGRLGSGLATSGNSGGFNGRTFG